MAGIREGREPLARVGRDVEIELAQDLAHGFGAKQQRLLCAACVQDPIGKDMAPVFVLGDLDLVNGEELDGHVHRHRLNGADPIAGAVGDDTFFASDERDGAFAFRFDHPVIDLTGEKPQRQPDHPGGMTHHSLQGVMGFAGIGRAKNGFENGHETAVSGRRVFAGRRALRTRLGLTYVRIDQISILIFGFKLGNPVAGSVERCKIAGDIEL